MNQSGRRLNTFTASSDLGCFQECQNYEGNFDYDDDTPLCNTVVRRPSNGDCYLYAETIEEATPSNMRVFVTYCASFEGPGA